MFSNGTEYQAFLDHHCSSCALYRPDAEVGKGCHVEEAIAMAGATGDLSDFPYDWLDENGLMHRYDCRRKARKKPNPIQGNIMRQRYSKPAPKMTEQEMTDLKNLLSAEPIKEGDG